MAEPQKVQITQEDIAKIKELPVKTYRVGNKELCGKYDSDRQLFYTCMDDGNWTGKVFIVKNPPQVAAEDYEEEVDEEDEDEGYYQGGEDNDENYDDEDGEDNGESRNPLKKLLSILKRDDEEKEMDEIKKEELKSKLNQPIHKKLPFTWLHAIIGVVALLLVYFFVIAPVAKRAFTPPTGPVETPPAQTQTQTSAPPDENPVESPELPPAETDPTLETIQVIQVTKTMIPGDVITEDCIQPAAIKSSDYEMLRANGRLLYQYESVNMLVGKYLNVYIPKGSYIASGDESTTYTPPKNPWYNEQEGRTYISVPLSKDEQDGKSPLINFGAIMDMTVINNIESTSGYDDNGLAYTTTTKKDYEKSNPGSFSNIIVCDMLNAKGESIFPKYYAYLTIPAAAQLDYIRSDLLENEGLAEDLTPAAFLVKIDSAIAEEIRDFGREEITVDFRLRDESALDMTNEDKQSFAKQVRELVETIAQAKQLNAEAAQQAAAEGSENQ